MENASSYSQNFQETTNQIEHKVSQTGNMGLNLTESYDPQPSMVFHSLKFRKHNRPNGPNKP